MLRKLYPFLMAALLTLTLLNCGGGGGGGGGDGDASDTNSEAVTLSGPDGSTLTTPVGGLNGGATVQLSTAADASGITDDGESVVSTPLLIDTTDDENALMGDGSYSLSIPVDSTKITDTNKLELKVKLTTGAVYPVFGSYDSQTGLFKAELSGLMDGWVIAVVEDPSIQVILPSGGTQMGVRGWLTDLDWQTYEWAVVNHTTMTEADVREKILPVMWSCSETLANAGFRSPKIYIDPRLTPQARVVHLVGGIGPNDEGSHFSPGAITYADGSWIYTEEKNTFDTSLLDDEEMSALGQMYVNYDQFVDLNAKYGVTLENIVIHELFHSVQHGYDIRKTQGSLKAYFEGTATPVGQTYQAAASISGPSIAVRVLRPNEHARLYQAVDDPTKPFYYTKQDFFAYVSKRYGGNSFKWTEQLFEYMSIKVSGKFGLTDAQYRALYRAAMDEAFQNLFSKSLSKIYKEYALDRAYQHDASYQLRPTEETEENGFGPDHLAKTLFKLNDADEKGFKELDPYGENKIVEFEKIAPLSCSVFYMMVPEKSGSEEQESFPLIIKLENGEVLSGSDNGVKIVAFIEDMNETMVENGMVEITDISKPVEIPFMEGGEYLTVLVMNCYVEDKSVKATVSAGPYIENLSPNPAVPGAEVTLSGISFGASQGKSTLHLGGQEITDITSWTDTEIKFTLSATAQSDKVKVTVAGVASNEAELSVGETEGNWEMLLEIWNVDDTCDNAMPHYWDFLKIMDRMPVSVASDGKVSFDYSGSGNYFQNVGGSTLHVWGTGKLLNNNLETSGRWTHSRSWTTNYTEYENGTGRILDVTETWTISADGTFTTDGHFDTIMGYWWRGDFSANYTAASSYVKIRDGEEVDSDADSCSGTITSGMNGIEDFKKKE